MSQVSYSDALDAEDQVDAEEMIAATIFDDPDVDISEGDAADLGRRILYKVLRRFRPDLFLDAQET